MITSKEKIVLIPNDPTAFLRELLTTEKAEYIAIYEDGTATSAIWEVKGLAAHSDLMQNIRSHSWNRKENPKRDQLVRVVYQVLYPDGYARASTKTVRRKRKTDAEALPPFTPPVEGSDHPSMLIRYANNVQAEIQVPGLCQYLEGEYECIVGFARHLLSNHRDALEFEQIPVILKKERESRVYENSDEYVKEKINQLIAQGVSVTTEDVSRILRTNSRLLGKFVEKPEPHIEIYYRQFKAPSFEEYAACVAQTLAHEYAHFLEYSYCRRQGVNPFTDERVSEALADFFGFLFSLNCHKLYAAPEYLQAAEKKYVAWQKHIGSSWPYANALHFCRVGGKELKFVPDYDAYSGHGCDVKFVQVFFKTHRPKDAYEAMIHT